MFSFDSFNPFYVPLIQPPICVFLAVHFWASAGIWANWSTASSLTSEHRAHPRRARRTAEQYCPAVLTSLSITRSAWCSAPNWALENQWSPSQPSFRNFWESTLGRSSLETCLSKTCSALSVYWKCHRCLNTAHAQASMKVARYIVRGPSRFLSICLWTSLL